MKSLIAFALLAFSSFALPAAAQEPDLTVSGAIASPDPVTFSIADLETMDVTVIETTTPWFDGVTRFEGVRLDDLMETLGAQGETLSVVALNDYVSDIPFTDLAQHGPILAYKRDGAYMPLEDKGPLFVIYPYDSDPDLATQQFFARSVWQVSELQVR